MDCDIFDILGCFRLELSLTGDKTAQNYSKAVSSLARFVESEHTQIFSERLLSNWISYLLQQGITPKVALYYLKVISSLYNKGVKAGYWEASGIFKSLKSKLSLYTPDEDFLSKRLDQFHRVRKIAQGGCNLTDREILAQDIFLTCILTGGKSPESVALLRKEQIGDFIPEVAEILERNISPKRKYIFNLGQSLLTGNQLSAKVNGMFDDVFLSRGINKYSSVDETIINLWANIALANGFSAEEIIACLGERPTADPIFTLGEMTSINDADKHVIISKVAKAIMVNPQQWFVMRLRPNVRYKQLEDRLSVLNNEFTNIQLFYPCEEIKKRVRRKLVSKQKPMIPDIVFFKAKENEVNPLFHRIGDIAWCYADNSRPNFKYAVVPRKAMERFQRAIGKFTPDYEVGPIGSITPREGDRIEIIGGLFSGNEGVIDKVETKSDSGNVIYRVTFPDQQGIEWRVSVDSRLVKNVI